MEKVIVPFAKYAPALRLKILTEEVLPFVRKAFAQAPELQSALLLVAQYWSDNAEDAVHGRMLFSELPTPDVKAYFRAQQHFTADTVNRTNPPLDGDTADLAYVNWDDNGKAVIAFAAYCREDMTQFYDFYEDAYSAYAVFRKQADGIDLQVVGEQMRPWIDGVRPAYWCDLDEETDLTQVPSDLAGWYARLAAISEFPCENLYLPGGESSSRYDRILVKGLAPWETCRAAGRILALAAEDEALIPFDEASAQWISASEYSYWYRDQKILRLAPIPDFTHWHWPAGEK